jgi:hypothetical protein
VKESAKLGKSSKEHQKTLASLSSDPRHAHNYAQRIPKRGCRKRSSHACPSPADGRVERGDRLKHQKIYVHVRRFAAGTTVAPGTSVDTEVVRHRTPARSPTLADQTLKQRIQDTSTIPMRVEAMAIAGDESRSLTMSSFLVVDDETHFAPSLHLCGPGP